MPILYIAFNMASATKDKFLTGSFLILFYYFTKEFRLFMISFFSVYDLMTTIKKRHYLT